MPILTDWGEYLGNESTFYKVLKEEGMLAHRGRARKTQKRLVSTHRATAPDPVWMWDITYLNGSIKGQYYYLYLVSDQYSRKIVEPGDQTLDKSDWCILRMARVH